MLKVLKVQVLMLERLDINPFAVDIIAFSFSIFLFSASALRALSSRDFLNIFMKTTKIDVTENRRARNQQGNIHK